MARYTYLFVDRCWRSFVGRTQSIPRSGNQPTHAKALLYPPTMLWQISGDALGLEAFITLQEALQFARRISTNPEVFSPCISNCTSCAGTTGFLYPIGLDNFYDGNLDSLTYFVDDEKKVHPINFQELILKAGATVLNPPTTNMMLNFLLRQ